MKQITKQKIMVVCDLDETYAFRMAEYMAGKGTIPYTLHLFTKTEKLIEFVQEEKIEILLISEGALQKLPEELEVETLFVLQEGEDKKQEERIAAANCQYINKFQSPDKIFQAMTEQLEAVDNWYMPQGKEETKLRLIGIYSPIKRCLQTSFALTMGQLLAKEHKVLYLNFESYSGFSQMMQREFRADISDMVYYFKCAKEKLMFRLPSLIQNVNGLDFIPPGQSFADIQAITGSQWIELLHILEQGSGYEYVILDLTDSMNGLFELLMQCFKIYTIVKEDSFAMAKMKQYEEILQLNELNQIADKTVKCRFPFFEKLPSQLELMTHGEFAGYVKAIIQEDLYENEEK